MRNKKVFSKSLATLVLVASFGLAPSTQAASVTTGSGGAIQAATSNGPNLVAVEACIAEQSVLNSPIAQVVNSAHTSNNPVGIDNHSFAKGLGIFLALAMVLAGVNMRRRGVREMPRRQSAARPRYRPGGRSFDPRRAA
jgi:hypothetical protein